jgi:hypothetical protein
MRKIHPDLSNTKKACALGTYVKRKAFPLEELFASIEEELEPAIAASRARLGKGEDDGTSLISVIADMYENDPQLLAYVMDETNHQVPDPETWRKVCRALGWTVVQEYDKWVEARK